MGKYNWLYNQKSRIWSPFSKRSSDMQKYLSTWSYVCISISLHVTNFSQKWFFLVFQIFCMQLWDCSGWNMIGPYFLRKFLLPQFLGSFLCYFKNTFFFGMNQNKSPYDEIISCAKPTSKFLVLKYNPKYHQPIKIYNFLISSNFGTNSWITAVYVCI